MSGIVGSLVIILVFLLIFWAFEKVFDTKEVILRILRDAHPRSCFAFEIIEASKGKLKQKAIYVYLDLLEDEGLIKSFIQKSDVYPELPKRRLYAITPSGLRHMQAIEDTKPVLSTP